MSETGRPFENYFLQTRSLLYSYLISLPLFLLYEILIVISQPNPQYAVRVAVDVWFHFLLSYLGNNVLSLTLILVALIGVIILYRERANFSTLKPTYFFAMLGEAFVYAISLALFLSYLVHAFVQMVPPESEHGLSTLQQIALSLGAGVFEELFFRVILVSGLLFIFNYFFTKRRVAYLLSMIIAAIIFSAVHYIGAFGDTFAIGSFLFRFLFGLALNGIYLWRGFGTAAWTHAFYDIMVVV